MNTGFGIIQQALRLVTHTPPEKAEGERETTKADIDAYRHLLVGDRFESKWCIRCCLSPALFALPFGELIGACPSCLAQRIALAQEKNMVRLPFWIRWLAWEAVREAERQSSKSVLNWELRWDDMYRCHRCSKFIQQADARYPSGEGAVRYPHCLNCYSELEREDN